MFHYRVSFGAAVILLILSLADINQANEYKNSIKTIDFTGVRIEHEGKTYEVPIFNQGAIVTDDRKAFDVSVVKQFTGIVDSIFRGMKNNQMDMFLSGKFTALLGGMAVKNAVQMKWYLSNDASTGLKGGLGKKFGTMLNELYKLVEEELKLEKEQKAEEEAQNNQVEGQKKKKGSSMFSLSRLSIKSQKFTPDEIEARSRRDEDILKRVKDLLTAMNELTKESEWGNNLDWTLLTVDGETLVDHLLPVLKWMRQKRYTLVLGLLKWAGDLAIEHGREPGSEKMPE